MAKTWSMVSSKTCFSKNKWPRELSWFWFLQRLFELNSMSRGLKITMVLSNVKDTSELLLKIMSTTVRVSGFRVKGKRYWTCLKV